MAIGIFAAVLGLLVATAAIVIPRIVSRRNDPGFDADSRAYMKETGRSARDIAQDNADQDNADQDNADQDNADQAVQQENDAGLRRAGGQANPDSELGPVAARRTSSHRARDRSAAPRSRLGSGSLITGRI